MDRLTRWLENKTALCFAECQHACSLVCYESELTCKCRPVTEAKIKLAAYEDTGLEPQEVQQLVKMMYE